MFARLIMMIITRKIIRMVGEKHGGVAGAAIGAALASRKTRVLGLGGAAALTAYEVLKKRNEQRRLPAPMAASPTLPARQ